MEWAGRGMQIIEAVGDGESFWGCSFNRKTDFEPDKNQQTKQRKVKQQAICFYTGNATFWEEFEDILGSWILI